MPADTRCFKETELTDAEIAGIVRSAAVNGMAGPFGFIDSTAECILAAGHAGDECLAWVGYLERKPGGAWLRWGKDGRRIDWLADCPAEDCGLYRGHPGECTANVYPDDGEGDDDAR